MTKETEEQLFFHHIRVNLSNDVNDNFVSLPGSVVQTLEATGIPIQEFGISILLNGEEKLHVGWNGYDSQGYLNGQSTIDINPILAKEANLTSGVQVSLAIKRLDQRHIAQEVFVEPLTSDDWEIIESHATFFQDEILHQTRIVTLSEALICYVDNVVSRFVIKKIVPHHLKSARIDRGSLVVVAPRENLKRAQKNHTNTERRRSMANRETNPINWHVKRSLYPRETNKITGLRILLNSEEIHSRYACLSILQNSIEFKKSAKQEKPAKNLQKIIVEVQSGEVPRDHIDMAPLVWSALSFEPGNGTRINVDFIMDESSFATGKAIKVTLRPVLNEQEYSKKIEQHLVDDKYKANDRPPSNISDLMRSFDNTVLTNKTIFHNEKVLLEIIDDNSGKYLPSARFDWMSTDWRYLAHDFVKGPALTSFHASDECTNIGRLLDSKILEGNDITEKVSAFSAIPSTPSNCVLIEGGPGMGKTTILEELSKVLTLEQKKYVKYVDCDTLLESSNLGKMKQLLQEWCSICYWRHPSVLLLDNAESLFPSVKSEDPQQQAIMQRGGASSTRLALHLINTVQGIFGKNSAAVKVIMTTENKSSLNNALFDKHFVCEIFKRKSPDVEERSRFIEFFFKNDYNRMSIDGDLGYRDIALETEGYSPLDLKILIEKLFYEGFLRPNHTVSQPKINREAFLTIIKSFTPSALRGVKLTKSTGVSWKDIGALKGPKRLLLETLEWPTKYAPIFQNSPLQLRSGILLYGYPGCGKTLLASAVAQQCGLNFITVKGPEVLNKYIGASEQNIRDLFERAQSVKPCILFFDEFDSIAPKRGHDSTGVTDRIVNQLLTQMDGVEGLDGVYVLAATSRPDLIDPALLRPGRIDRCVLCNIPDENDRYEILKAVTISGKMNVDQNTDLRTVAKKTQGYSGADIQGLCYNAYLKSIHRHTSADQNLHDEQNKQKFKPEHRYKSLSRIDYTIVNEGPSGLSDDEKLRIISHCIDGDPHQSQAPFECEQTVPDNGDLPVTIIVTTEDLLEACKETKPSITTSEFYKLQLIYSTFQDDRDGNMPTAENANDVGTRASLM